MDGGTLGHFSLLPVEVRYTVKDDEVRHFEARPM